MFLAWARVAHGTWKENPMRLDRLTHNSLSPAAFDWYQRYLVAVDAKDLAGYAAFLAEGVTLQMNDAPPVNGKAAVLAGLAAYWPSFGTLEHDLLRIYGTDTAFVLEAENHYVRHDGRPVTLRAVAFTDRDASGLATSIRLYTDTSRLFA